MRHANDQPEFLHPDYEPGELDRMEGQLRHALAVEASRIHPADRIDEVLRTAHEAGPTSDGVRPRRWLGPVSVAATVALIAGGAWAATHRSADQLVPAPPASSGPGLSATTGQPTGSSTVSSGTPTSGTPTAPPAGLTTASLPVYFVGPIGDSKGTHKLFREFLPGALHRGASPAERAKAALVLAVDAYPGGSTAGYLQPWSGQTIADVTVTDRTITVALANGGASGLSAETQRLAVQELVWTAQAAVGKGTIPVRFAVADGSAALFGRFPTSRTYNRPGSDQLFQDLAPVWVTTPGRGQVLPVSKPVHVQGQAIVFEGAVSWQLTRGQTQVKAGHTTATAGAPAQGSYSVDLGLLTPGDYTVRVFEVSMADGSVAAQEAVGFTVR
ncbi:Gmad2 immunoglobulin-like domain-containing protein [Pedococcus sp.]|uniref:Gmad2 immunoglobulin-like domain-containing protein n=1 Tax=Pedococcus sp. TaxID=2860345 RepID=UPI002E11869D|nr:Gmad2 immunoglobulin-like domain-containing protein [Pedococcus sp.]